MLERFLAHSIPDPAQNTLWWLTVPFSNGQVYHVLAERCSATFPKTSFRPRPTDGKQSYYPETTDLDGLNIAFYEAFDYRVTNWLNTWRKLIRDDDGNYGPPALYKRDIQVRSYARTDLRSPVLSLTYVGCAPTDQTPFEFNYDDETGRMVVEAQFSVDNMTMEQGDG